MASSSSRNRVLNPGPEDGSLLRFQSIHVSEHIWDRREHPILKVRRSHFISAGMEGVPMEILPHLTLAGFVGVAQLACFPIDRHLITALVERWRPETHTFHMSPRACTITLQDIAIQIGPPDDAFAGSNLKLSWLDQHFTHVAMHNHNELQLTRFARAYILRLIGGFMLADHSSSRVPVRYLPLLEDFTIIGEYSWGAATLAFLYRELCMSTNIDRSGIGGLTPLLMM
ncbi:protein MAIN-LIKE 2-like [Abrus precatorius]|uniref:Protein MAIN-LIKE 2-like n=1 Tax=Abrus precatorius TaxID=3816 RepID=A0A8B8MNI1_ABRPR|nr:protein MAIN-LIKE 2-like [Abrus precatorius]